MPSSWVLTDLLTMKIKLRCTKNTVLVALPLLNGKDPNLDPYQIVGSDPYQIKKEDPDLKSFKTEKQDQGSGSVSKWSGSATLSIISRSVYTCIPSLQQSLYTRMSTVEQTCKAWRRSLSQTC
jgi:hypothetical protein